MGEQGNRGWKLMIVTCLLLQTGCASWLPNHEEPASTHASFAPQTPSIETVGIETLLVRLDASQAERVSELWAFVDEQAIKPETRIAMDRNGIRAGKIASNMPPLLEQWVRQTMQRVDENPLEQAGYAADVSSYSQLWRCRSNTRKELTIRRLNGPVEIRFDKGTPEAGLFDSPHFFYSINAAPAGDSSATVRLTPELEHGDFVRKVVAREAAIRPDNRRESIVWQQLSIDLRLKQGDYILVGPTEESRGLGEHYFHTQTQNGDIQPVLLVVRLSESRLDDSFANPKHTALKR